MANKTPSKAAPTKATTATKGAAKDLPTKAKKPVKEKVARIKENGVTRPAAGTKTGQVWDIADEHSKLLKEPAGRKLVMDSCIAAKINKATAATQYGLWRKFNGLEGKKVAAKKADPVKKDVPAKKVTTAEGTSE